MRKYDVEVLKDSLDVEFPNANVMLLEILMMMWTSPLLVILPLIKKWLKILHVTYIDTGNQ
jgi:hypothetical protein